MRTVIFIFLLVLCTLNAGAQERRFQFAHSYIGFAGEIGGQRDGYQQRLLLGATHFWTYADFYLSIPLFKLPFSADRSRGVITGARLLPFKLSPRTVNPHVGLYWSTPSYESQNAYLLAFNKLGFDIGANLLLTKRASLSLSVQLESAKPFSYQMADSRSTVKLSSAYYQIGLRKYFDFTRSYGNPASRKFRVKLDSSFRINRHLNCYTLAIGFSSFHGLPSPPETADFLPDYSGLILGLDAAAGYFFQKPGISLNLTYRAYRSRDKGFKGAYLNSAVFMGLEAHKMLFDYHGFVPFAGLMVSGVNINQSLNGELLQQFQTPVRPGFVFGWDIRPTQQEVFVLRTNIRYSPNFLQPNSIEVSRNQLEINFIQLLLYPQRIRDLKNLVK